MAYFGIKILFLQCKNDTNIKNSFLNTEKCNQTYEKKVFIF